MPLRLGVMGAIFDEAGRVLLSKRNDLKVWNLPGGRVDSGETLTDAAAREVREETGIVAHIERAVGLYYAVGWQRLNVLFAGMPVGGQLLGRSVETQASAYVDLAALPRMWGDYLVRDAVAPVRPLPRSVETTPRELRQIRRRLRWRWIRNLLSGRPEPRYPVFQVQACALIWDLAHRRILTLPGQRSQTLPRVTCDGAQAPWQELGVLLQKTCHIAPPLHWVGLWQDAARSRLEFVFAATLPEASLPGGAEWTRLETAALGDRDMLYAQKMKASFASDPVWIILHDDVVGHNARIRPARSG